MEQTSRALIEKFYSAFRQLDAEGMCACYDEEVVFHDPVFGLLRGPEVRAMWKMLCARADGFSLRFSPANDLGDGYYTCDWEATYLYSSRKRQVVNKGRANMRVENGRITEHSDAFSLPGWCRQALGWKGYLLGWNGYFQRQVQLKARRGLIRFMNG